ncbi:MULTISPECIES: hypothetical protein [Tessaracoccus]|uniref:Uncharacterized protein n=2 Tax=Tessaracoccus TaxID=72763 RepID=A0A1Q2CRI0_9ACTN|nr:MULTISPECIES: hypothetical protein [Tessaracoccus]AQP48707.1 hypothetical protein BW730_15545 [Tessaracoccus aquimaris]QNP55883.1 hypothetical protein H9L22_17550 [Tessaracoccus defluvii]
MVKSQPIPDEDAWWNGLMWVDGARMQARRFEDVLNEWLDAEYDTKHRHRNSGDDDIERGWRDETDRNYRPYDSRRPIRVVTVALAMQLAVDLRFLIVACNHVMTALKRIPADARPTMSGQELLHLMRNVSEHWEEAAGPSATKLALANVDHTTITFSGNQAWIGDGRDAIPMSRVHDWLERSREALVAALAGAGHDVPDETESNYAGDDELEWPLDRLRYHWALPHIELEEWDGARFPPGAPNWSARKQIGWLRAQASGATHTN